MQAFNAVSLEAFEQLLAQPDPKDLPRRGHVLRWAGEPDRRSTRLLPIVIGWLQRRFLEIDVEEPLAPAMRAIPATSAPQTWKRRAGAMSPDLRLLRRTGGEQPAMASGQEAHERRLLSCAH